MQLAVVEPRGNRHPQGDVTLQPFGETEELAKRMLTSPSSHREAVDESRATRGGDERGLEHVRVG